MKTGQNGTKAHVGAVQKTTRVKRVQRATFNAALSACCLALLLATCTARAATHNVQVGGPEGPYFFPSVLEIQPGDTVKWTWYTSTHMHTVTSGKAPNGDGRFNTVERIGPYTFSYTFKDAGEYRYFCATHVGVGFDATGAIFVGVPARQFPAQPLNVSTRLRVQNGENAMIGGFIITGSAPKKVMVRAIGASLAKAGVADALADPTMALLTSGNSIASNDDWRQGQQLEIRGTGIAPSDDRESAIVATLEPGSYTAVVEAKSDTSGVGLVEVYDLEQTGDSKLANISTRGVVGTGSDVMIAGFILGNDSGAARVVVRAIGPSLSGAGIDDVLADPTLQLRNSNGESVAFNDNWRDNQQGEIDASGIPPSHDLESAVVATLAPGAYTALVAGTGGTSGVALVEVYNVD